MPAHFTYWRYPNTSHYTVSPPENPNTLRLSPSFLNLTALNGNYAGPLDGPDGQTFVGRRQQDTLFTFSVDLSFSPTVLEEEAGVSAFLTQNHHLDIGIVLLPASASTAHFPGTNATTEPAEDPSALIPQVRFRGISYIPVPDPVVVPVPKAWRGSPLTLEIKAANGTHFAFSVGPAGHESEMRTVLTASNDAVSWGFTGVILGTYCTSNGGKGMTPGYFSRWQYIPQGQFRN